MKYKSEVLTQASGSIGGTTYSHNRGGLYRRARTIPTNPNTVRQQATRSIFGGIANAWREVLSDAQRASWKTYADASPVVDVLGDPLILTGQQMFIRCNTVIVGAGKTRVDDGPVDFGLTTLSIIQIVPVYDSDDFSVLLDNADPWANIDDGGLSVQVGEQKSKTINFFKGPYRYADTIDGATATPPPISANIPNPFGTVYGPNSKVFGRFTAFLPDGRISNVVAVGG